MRFGSPVLLLSLCLCGGGLAGEERPPRPPSSDTVPVSAPPARPSISAGALGGYLLAGGLALGIPAAVYGLAACSPLEYDELPRGCEVAEAAGTVGAVALFLGGLMLLADGLTPPELVRQKPARVRITPVLRDAGGGRLAPGAALTARW